MAKSRNGLDAAVETALATVAPDPASLVQSVTPELLEGVRVERIVTLEAGQAVCGIYLGEGAHVEVNDPVTGEVRDLATHRIEVRPNIVARLIESHQLKRELPQHLNKEVRVIKLGLVDTRGGRRVNDFIVAPVVTTEATVSTSDGTTSGRA